MSRRDRTHVLTALWDLSGARADVGVAVAGVDAAIGRGRRDMRTPLDLQALRDDGHVCELLDGVWALTPEGVAWLKQDRELSDRY